eukprot:6239691-Lingulodinium_polyedra.AAC.1
MATRWGRRETPGMGCQHERVANDVWDLHRKDTQALRKHVGRNPQRRRAAHSWVALRARNRATLARTAANAT